MSSVSQHAPMEYADLIHRAVYHPRSGAKVKSRVRAKVLLNWIRFLTAEHTLLGAMMKSIDIAQVCIIAHADVLRVSDLIKLCEMMPHEFIFVVANGAKVDKLHARVIKTPDGGIDEELATRLGDEHPCAWFICGKTVMETEEDRVTLATACNVAIARMQPARALVPFRQPYVVGRVTVAVRYNGPLWLQPWSKMGETVTMLAYEDGQMIQPCETPIEYEQKMFYWNKHIRCGTQPGERQKATSLRADLAIESYCLSRLNAEQLELYHSMVMN
jgi:hypothetical protein